MPLTIKQVAANLDRAAKAGKLEHVLRNLPDASVTNCKSAAYYRILDAQRRIAEIEAQRQEDLVQLVEDLLGGGSDGWSLRQIRQAARQTSKQV